jgi:hypothetical protein
MVTCDGIHCLLSLLLIKNLIFDYFHILLMFKIRGKSTINPRSCKIILNSATSFQSWLKSMFLNNMVGFVEWTSEED